MLLSTVQTANYYNAIQLWIINNARHYDQRYQLYGFIQRVGQTQISFHNNKRCRKYLKQNILQKLVAQRVKQTV